MAGDAQEVVFGEVVLKPPFGIGHEPVEVGGGQGGDVGAIGGPGSVRLRSSYSAVR